MDANRFRGSGLVDVVPIGRRNPVEKNERKKEVGRSDGDS
jgi:hypothetical protein